MIQLKDTKNWEITQDHPRTGRPRTARTPKKIKAVRERIRRNPQRTIKGMAESLGISPYSMLSIVKKDLINILEIVSPALIEMKSKWKNEVFTFQHDGAPSHTSKKTQSWSRENSPSFWGKEMWPPSSPDLNPLDFSIRSMLKKDARRSEKLSVDHLKKSLQKAWADILQKKIRAAVEALKSRLEKVIDANDGQIK